MWSRNINLSYIIDRQHICAWIWWAMRTPSRIHHTACKPANTAMLHSTADVFMPVLYTITWRSAMLINDPSELNFWLLLHNVVNPISSRPDQSKYLSLYYQFHHNYSIINIMIQARGLSHDWALLHFTSYYFYFAIFFLNIQLKVKLKICHHLLK